MPGMVLGGRYQVQDKIGTGGMATVFRGHDEVLGRTVAIKTMLPQYATDPSFAARFKQEAQAAAALQSPYIVSVYDWGKDADTYYIVMEYLRGTDLKSGIRKHGALDCKKVAQIGSQIAQALSVAHKHDIIHRDIKPQNIMVQPDGNIKVMDFGIARAKNSHLTTDNSVLGTAHYVSPEQTQGKELGPTTDLYSLGIVMYEASTGQVPFQGDDAITVALKQVNERPKPPSQLNPAVDPSLESIILKCMQKDPAARFQTADELYRTLRDYLAGRMQSVNSATAMLPAAATTALDRTGATGATSTLPAVERTGRFRPQSATEQAAEQEAEKARKKKRNIALGVVGALALIAVIIFAVVSTLGSSTTAKAVPNLLGYTQDEAVKKIEEEGFAVGSVNSKYDSSVAEGKVCDQDPVANLQMPEGSTVNIWISKGAEPAEEVEVPDLTNKSAADAESALEDVGLVGKVGSEEENDDVAAGKVSSQDPKAGTTAKAGDTVTFHLSTGPSQVVVPNVVGDDESTATSRLTQAGFKVSAKSVSSSTVAKGNVVSTDPDVNTSADKGATVTLYVSSGPESVTITNVVGMSYSDAKSTLENAGFIVNLASGSSAEGTVVSQSATGKAAKGTTITLTTKAAPTGGTGADGNSTNGNGAGTGNGTGTGTGTGDTGSDPSGN